MGSSIHEAPGRHISTAPNAYAIVGPISTLPDLQQAVALMAGNRRYSVAMEQRDGREFYRVSMQTIAGGMPVVASTSPSDALNELVRKILELNQKEEERRARIAKQMASMPNELTHEEPAYPRWTGD